MNAKADSYPEICPKLKLSDYTSFPAQNRVMLNKDFEFKAWGRNRLPFDFFQYWRWN